MDYEEDYDYQSSDDFYDSGIDEDLVLDCGYPGCIMPGYHFPSECHSLGKI